jgi:hypothetical protein
MPILLALAIPNISRLSYLHPYSYVCNTESLLSSQSELLVYIYPANCSFKMNILLLGLPLQFAIAFPRPKERVTSQDGILIQIQ